MRGQQVPGCPFLFIWTLSPGFLLGVRSAWMFKTGSHVRVLAAIKHEHISVCVYASLQLLYRVCLLYSKHLITPLYTTRKGNKVCMNHYIHLVGCEVCVLYLMPF